MKPQFVIESQFDITTGELSFSCLCQLKGNDYKVMYATGRDSEANLNVWNKWADIGWLPLNTVNGTTPWCEALENGLGDQRVSWTPIVLKDFIAEHFAELV